MAKVRVDKEKCIGCGACVAMLPEVFEMREGKSHVKNENGASIEKIKETAQLCPVGAIIIED